MSVCVYAFVQWVVLDSVETKIQGRMLFLVVSPLHFLRKGLSLNLVVRTGQRGPRTHLSLLDSSYCSYRHKTSSLAFHMGSGYPNHVTILMQQVLYPLGLFIQSPSYALCVSCTFKNLLCDFAVIKVVIVFLFGLIVLFVSQFIFMFLYYIFNAYSTSWKWWTELFWHACLGSFKKGIQSLTVVL